MIKPIWAAAGVVLLGTAGVAGALVVASPDGEEEVVQQVTTAIATASSAPTSSQPPTPTTVAPAASPAPTPQPTAEAIPADWQTYTDPEGRFNFRYPSQWYMEPGGSVYSWDYTVPSRPFYPSDGIAVQAIVGPVDQAEARPAEATDAMLGSEAGWERVREYEPSQAVGSVREHVVAADRAGLRFFLIGTFGPTADVGVFRLIVSSFRFSK